MTFTLFLPGGHGTERHSVAACADRSAPAARDSAAMPVRSSLVRIRKLFMPFLIAHNAAESTIEVTLAVFVTSKIQ